MKATVGNLKKLIANLPDSALIVSEDWDGSAIIKQIPSTGYSKPLPLEKLLNVYENTLYIVSEEATDNNCHAWDRERR